MTAPGAARPYWNPYVAGVALGLVLLTTFAVMGHGIGASGALAATVAAGVNDIAPRARGLQRLPRCVRRRRGATRSRARSCSRCSAFSREASSRRALAGRLAAARAGTAHRQPGTHPLGPGRWPADGFCVPARAGLHQRPGPHRWRVAQRGQLGVHDRDLRGRLRRGTAGAEAMDMILPLFPAGAFSERTSFLVAGLTGVAFGFVLERGDSAAAASSPGNSIAPTSPSSGDVHRDRDGDDRRAAALEAGPHGRQPACGARYVGAPAAGRRTAVRRGVRHGRAVSRDVGASPRPAASGTRRC